MSFPIKITKTRPTLLISGEPGTGKSFWIQTQSQKRGAKLFRWNARMDRSLREGREILHQQVRSKELLYVWIEGADDLTQEAQAFLRRILETSSENVTCILEVREPWKLSPPILSRCQTISMPSSISFRQKRNLEQAKRFGLPVQEEFATLPSWNEIVSIRKRGGDPYAILQKCIATYGIQNEGLQECIRGIGSGSSPWIQLTKFLYSSAVRGN
jgi:hypothetical protein